MDDSTGTIVVIVIVVIAVSMAISRPLMAASLLLQDEDGP